MNSLSTCILFFLISLDATAGKCYVSLPEAIRKSNVQLVQKGSNGKLVNTSQVCEIPIEGADRCISGIIDKYIDCRDNPAPAANRTFLRDLCGPPYIELIDVDEMCSKDAVGTRVFPHLKLKYITAPDPDYTNSEVKIQLIPGQRRVQICMNREEIQAEGELYEVRSKPDHSKLPDSVMKGDFLIEGRPVSMLPVKMCTKRIKESLFTCTIVHQDKWSPTGATCAAVHRLSQFTLLTIVVIVSSNVSGFSLI